MRRPPALTRSEVSSVVLIVDGIVFVFAVAVMIGAALAVLPFVWGMVVAFFALVVVVALIAFELPRFWARLPR